MKTSPRILVGAISACLLFACQSAKTQSSGPEPSVIVVPPDELSQEPGTTSPSILSTKEKKSPRPLEESSPLPSATSAGKVTYTECNVDGPYIAMTFDDGPSATLTPKLLDMLKERGIKATFFVVGQCAAEYPDIMKRIAAEGHEIGNHSWNHQALSKLGSAGVESQILKTNEAITAATGQKVTIMRPPYGATTTALSRRIEQIYGLKVIMWSVDPQDWKYRNSNRIFNEIIKGTQPGSIILTHDIHPTTVAAMPETFDALLAKGYRFLTVSELIERDKPEPPRKKEAPPTPTPAQ